MQSKNKKLSEIASMSKTEEETKYTQQIWGHIPQIPIKDQDEKLIGLVQWSDNLTKAHKSNDGYYYSLGITKLEQGPCVMIETLNGQMYGRIVSDYAAIIFIISYGKYELLDKFELREKATYIISNEFKLSKVLDKDVYKIITKMETLKLPKSLEYGYESVFEEWDSVFGIATPY